MFKYKMNNVQKIGEFGLMADKRIEKRDNLKQKIISLAQIRIATAGLSSLRARDLASEAGCALGGLYNMFTDLDGIILEVNARTLIRIDDYMEQAVAARSTAAEQMKALAQAYLSFARENPLLWRALFEHQLPHERALPDWYSESLNHLMARIAQPLAILQPSYSRETIAIRARTIFAAVHGVVSISLDNRFVGLASDQLDGEIDRFVELLLLGSAASN
jgi:AcrR family transcriptional regulator